MCAFKSLINVILFAWKFRRSQRIEENIVGTWHRICWREAQPKLVFPWNSTGGLQNCWWWALTSEEFSEFLPHTPQENPARVESHWRDCPLELGTGTSLNKRGRWGQCCIGTDCVPRLNGSNHTRLGGSQHTGHPGGCQPPINGSPPLVVT